METPPAYGDDIEEEVKSMSPEKRERANSVSGRKKKLEEPEEKEEKHMKLDPF